MWLVKLVIGMAVGYYAHVVRHPEFYDVDTILAKKWIEQLPPSQVVIFSRK